MNDIILTDARGTPQPRMDAVPSVSGYPAAQNSPLRTSFLAFPTNSRQEITAHTRKEIVRKVRALDACLGFIGRFKQKTGQHAVGKGIFPRPSTDAEEWNQKCKAYHDELNENPLRHSIDGSRDFYEDQRLAAEAHIDDGEYFSALVNDDEDGQLKVQPLDPFEIEQPWKADLQEWNDGVRTDSIGRVLEYAVMELPGLRGPINRNSRMVEAANMLHLFKRRRAKQWRGLPMVYAGVNSLIDALDLKCLEVGTAKLHSALGMVVRKQKGEAGKSGITNQLTKILGDDGKVTKVSENFWQGAGIQYLGLDEGIELLTSDRPSPNLIAFIEFLYRDAAVGTGLPYEVLYDLSKLGGATARGVLEDAQWFFEQMQDRVIMRHSRPLYILRTARAIATGALPPCPDPKWWTCDWQGPAKLTVDAGRTADSNIKLLKNGGMTFEGYFEERGLDARTQHMRQIRHIQWLQKECEKAGVPLSMIIESTPGVNVAINQGGSNLPPDES